MDDGKTSVSTMTEKKYRVGVVAAGSPIERRVEQETLDLVTSDSSLSGMDVVFHSQCFETDGHFAGADARRSEAFLEVANNPDIDALWFARGGYGACRLMELILPKLNDHAKRKQYLGYSDSGFLLGALYNLGFPRLAHGPMPQDITRENGAVAVKRALLFLCNPSAYVLEPSVAKDTKAAAFNITVLGHLIGTSYQPDLSGHILMLEDLSETAVSLDRSLQAIVSNSRMKNVAGIKLGRCSMAQPTTNEEYNLPEGKCAEIDTSTDEMVRYWCDRSGIPFLGAAKIGHDIDNQIVPFGYLQI